MRTGDSTFLFPFLVLSLALAPIAAQAQPSDPELENGIRLAQQGDFEAAITALDAVARRLTSDGGRATELARAYVYLSIAYLGLSQEQQAKARFVEALNTDRQMSLDADEFPPRIMEFFEQARQEAIEEGVVEPPPSGESTVDPASVPAAAAPLDTPPMTFKKVDFFQSEGEKEESFDARMAFHPGRREIVISDEDEGEQKHVYARIPYDKVTELAYEKSKHRRWTTGILLSPLALFTKGKKHWLTIAFEGVEELPQNFVYLRLDKKNFRQILSALEAQTGLEPSVSIEE